MTSGRFERAVGVDFSAARDGAARTWIAVAEPIRDGARLVALFPAGDLPGAGPRPEAFVPVLRRWLAGCGRALIGLDFPFSLPHRLLDGAEWLGFAAGFTARFPSPAAFRAQCRQATGGRELRRRCDVEARPPFAAYNLRLYRQTWWGIGHLLAPLASTGAVSVVPMQAAAPDRPVLAEICPASTLKRLGCYRPYKGPGRDGERRALLGRLALEGMAVPSRFAEIAAGDPGGDALDAIIAAATAARTARHPACLLPRDDIDRLEARIYV